MKLNFVYYYSRINIHIFVREYLCNAAAGNLHLPLALPGTLGNAYILFSTVVHSYIPQYLQWNTFSVKGIILAFT